MIRSTFCLSLLFCCLGNPLSAQTSLDTTAQEISPVNIKAYFSQQPLLQHTSSAKVIGRKVLEAQMPHTLVPAMNTIPGLRIEERSPGSYRIGLRGSMLRSPFGVRNTKIYLNEIPFTDAGGNTYFNLLDPIGIRDITVIKGPDGSIFGPNSGGVIRIQPKGLAPESGSDAQLSLTGGSFGLFAQQLALEHRVTPKYHFAINQAYTRADGYRENTALNKKYFQTTQVFNYSNKGEFRLLGLYSDVMYQTPGGLTQAQFDEDPRMARPATASMPGASDQNAHIRNKTVLGGLTHEYRFDDNWTHSATIFGTYTDFTNPFITNYENRYESNYGLRTHVSYNNSNNSNFLWQMQAGLETQYGTYKIRNFDNIAGEKGDAIQWDNLKNGQSFFFYRASANILEKLNIETSISLSNNSLSFHQLYPIEDVNRGEMTIEPTWLPRIAASYLITTNFALRSSVAKGLSTPTVAEVRSSNNTINPNLQSEYGTNYEAGARLELGHRRFIADLSAYTYLLKNGIVSHREESGAEYFVNAGEIHQKGVELMLMGEIISPRSESFVRSLHLSSNITYQKYRFGTYTNNGKNYENLKVTSVPEWMIANVFFATFPAGFGLNVTHNFTSEIPLDDANTVFAHKYHLLQAKGSWTTALQHHRLQLFVGVDNALNQTYSLGNDINAFGGRYFNAAPTRNYYAGVSFQL